MELDTCPFCGSSAEIERYGTSRYSTIYRCDECGCTLETGEEFDHGTQWNHRAEPKQVTELNDQITKLNNRIAELQAQVERQDGVLRQIADMGPATAEVSLAGTMAELAINALQPVDPEYNLIPSLRARVWKRTSLLEPEYVLELEGNINDVAFSCRHTQTLKTELHDVPGLPELYDALDKANADQYLIGEGSWS